MKNLKKSISDYDFNVPRVVISTKITLLLQSQLSLLPGRAGGRRLHWQFKSWLWSWEFTLNVTTSPWWIKSVNLKSQIQETACSTHSPSNRNTGTHYEYLPILTYFPNYQKPFALSAIPHLSLLCSIPYITVMILPLIYYTPNAIFWELTSGRLLGFYTPF